MYTSHSFKGETNYSKKKNSTELNFTDFVFTDFAKCIYKHAASERKVPIKWVETF